MMKLIHSFIHNLCPLALHLRRAALHFAGFLRTVKDLSARGYPLGTSQRAAFCSLTAHHLDPLHWLAVVLTHNHTSGTVLDWTCDLQSVTPQDTINYD